MGLEPVILPDDEVRMNSDDRRDLQEAKVKNRETTATAKRALRIARETQDVAGQTLASLDGQTHKIRQLDDKMVGMKEDVKKSESYLRYIGRACVCCSCCVKDPTMKEEGEWGKQVKRKQKKEKKDEAAAAKGKGAAAANGEAAASSSSHPNAEKRKGKEKLKVVSELEPLKIAQAGDLKEVNEDFMQQDRVVDEISAILGNLNDMGKAMGEEITKQNKLIEDLDGKAAPLKDRMRDMNTKTRLHKIHVKKEQSGSVIQDVGSTLMKQTMK